MKLKVNSKPFPSRKKGVLRSSQRKTLTSQSPKVSKLGDWRSWSCEEGSSLHCFVVILLARCSRTRYSCSRVPVACSLYLLLHIVSSVWKLISYMQYLITYSHKYFHNYRWTGTLVYNHDKIEGKSATHQSVKLTASRKRRRTMRALLGHRHTAPYWPQTTTDTLSS